jgi:hypothetical protein
LFCHEQIYIVSAGLAGKGYPVSRRPSSHGTWRPLPLRSAQRFPVFAQLLAMPGPYKRVSTVQIIEILEASRESIDPNLRALAAEQTVTPREP